MENNSKDSKLKNGESEGVEYKFWSNSETEILIGRSEIWNVWIKDKLLSRVQWCISFEQGKWILKDGFKVKVFKNNYIGSC